MENKRGYKRFHCAEAVEYGDSSYNAQGSLSSDISLGGIRLTVHQFVPIGAPLKMQINFSHLMRIIHVEGRVVWFKEISYGDSYQIGIEFLPDSDSQDSLMQVLSTNSFEPVREVAI